MNYRQLALRVDKAIAAKGGKRPVMVLADGDTLTLYRANKEPKQITEKKMKKLSRSRPCLTVRLQ